MDMDSRVMGLTGFEAQVPECDKSAKQLATIFAISHFSFKY